MGPWQQDCEHEVVLSFAKNTIAENRSILRQGSPAPRLWAGMSLRPMGSQATQLEVSETLSTFAVVPHRLLYYLSSTSCQISSSIGARTWLHLNHVETIPLTWSVGKLSFKKPVPGAKKVGDHCSKILIIWSGQYTSLEQPISGLHYIWEKI